jgi:hypothetical protein
MEVNTTNQKIRKAPSKGLRGKGTKEMPNLKDLGLFVWATRQVLSKSSKDIHVDCFPRMKISPRSFLHTFIDKVGFDILRI